MTAVPRVSAWRRLLRGAGTAIEVSSVLAEVFVEQNGPRDLPPAFSDPASWMALERDLAAHAWRITKALNLTPTHTRFAELAHVFRTPAFFELLLRRSRSEGRADRRRGIAVAELALASLKPLAWVLDSAAHAHLHARGWAALGNALTLARDLDLAETRFDQAEKLLSAYEPVPPRVRAEIFYLESCLRGARRQWDDALLLIERAAALVGDVDLEELRVEILLQRGGISWHRRRFAAALDDFQASAAILTETSAPFLHLAAHGNLATALASTKRHREAAVALAVAKTFAKDAEPCVLDHIAWLEGLLAIAAGNDTQAEQPLCHAREGFRKRRELGHLAIISLDIASLQARQNRHSEVADALSEALVGLEALRLDAETLAAVNMLRESMARRTLAARVVHHLRDRLAVVFQAPTI